MKHISLGTNQRTRLVMVAAAAVTLMLVGVVLLVMAVARPNRPPLRPPAVPAAAPASVSASVSASPPSAAPTPAIAPISTTQLARSLPQRLVIPSIGVSSPLLTLGLNPDKTMQVPPLERDSKAGWYKYSPTPGQMGPAVIVGHVDSAEFGPGVFFRLAALRPGDTINVTRADNTTAIFSVRSVASYSKASFPTTTVYGNTTRPELRLITCGGTFNSAIRSYDNNTVVYADYMGSRPTS